MHKTIKNNHKIESSTYENGLAMLDNLSTHRNGAIGCVRWHTSARTGVHAYARLIGYVYEYYIYSTHLLYYIYMHIKH